MPNTAHQMNYGLTPVEDGVTTFMGNPITWTRSPASPMLTLCLLPSLAR